MNNEYGVIVIGAGFYGCMIALNFAEQGEKVLLLDKERDILKRASASNQARIHNGYHYPRDFSTLTRSHANYKKFCKEFEEAIDDYSLMLYAIARNSKTPVDKFVNICNIAEIPLIPASKTLQSFFNPHLIESVFIVEENVFSANILRGFLERRLKNAKVDVFLDKRVRSVTEGFVDIEGSSPVASKKIICCAYSGINTILSESSLPELNLLNEIAVMPLIKVPKELASLGITVMDGDYFAIIPYPDTHGHTLHHVRYTPDPYSTYTQMITDASQYIPSLIDSKLMGEVREVKTILPNNDATDARPILYKKDYGFKGFDIVLGSKLDNVYDIIEKLNNPEAKNLNIV